MDDQAEDRRSVLEDISRRHDQRMLDEELSKLPEKDRESLTLRYLEDRSNSEIASVLEISVSAVESRLKRAKRRLRQRLLGRGISLGTFVGVALESRIDLRAVEPLIAGTVEIGLANVGEELVAKALSVGRAAHQPGDVHKSDRGRDDLGGVIQLGQCAEPRVGDADDAHVRLSRGERVIGRQGRGPS